MTARCAPEAPGRALGQGPEQGIDEVRVVQG